MEVALDEMKTGPYLNNWVFLHFINRELGLGVGSERLSEGHALEAIRLASLVLGTNLFCNVSQIHEHISGNESLITELIFLSSIGRFHPHSDYGSYNEFLESRQGMYFHDAERYPFFFKDPPKILKKLPHFATGKSASATSYIENGLRDWIDDHDKTPLTGMLTLEDASLLRRYDRSLSDILNGRDSRAMTFSLFAEDVDTKEPERFEGALRRGLSSLYVNSYRKNAASMTLSGLPGFSYFDLPEPAVGANIEFMRTVAASTGVSGFLSRKKNFGQKHREQIESTDASYHFRTAYAQLSHCFDELQRHRFDTKAMPLSLFEIRSTVANHFRRLAPIYLTDDFTSILCRAADGLEKLTSQYRGAVYGSRRGFEQNQDMNATTIQHSGRSLVVESNVSDVIGVSNISVGESLMSDLETVVFATANLRESQAVVDYLDQVSQQLGSEVTTHLNETLPYQEGRLPGKVSERRAIVVRADDTGPQEATDLLRRILDKFTPKYIFFVGCAALLDEKQEPDGNMVFVARRAIDVDKREKTDSGVLYDMEQATGDLRILRNIDALNTARRFEPLNVITNRYFLSGSAFLRSRKSAARKSYVEDFPQDAVVLEMESFAVIKAVQARRNEGLNVAVSIIKGISDSGDEGAQIGKNEAQRVATTNAMTVADKLLRAL